LSWTKQQLIDILQTIKAKGWIPSGRNIANVGGVGNTLEDLLGIRENNLPIANTTEWELKTQRRSTSSLTTLLHLEPEPRTSKIVPEVLLLKYGWAHKTIPNERSFRVTMSGDRFTDRGFKVNVDRNSKKIYVDFDSSQVASVHSDWLREVASRVGLGPINPRPYWTFEVLESKTKGKLKNMVYVIADSKKEGGIEHFKYKEAWFLTDFDFERFLKAIEKGNVLIDFDARTHHNHGTKFRVYDAMQTWASFYSEAKRVV